MNCSRGYKSAELKGDDQNLVPFLMSLSFPALIPFFYICQQNQWFITCENWIIEEPGDLFKVKRKEWYRNFHFLGIKEGGKISVAPFKFSTFVSVWTIHFPY